MSIRTHLEPTLPWDEARATFLTEYGAELLFDNMIWRPANDSWEGGGPAISDTISAETDRLTDVRCEAEEVMIAALAPDVASVIEKIEYARYRWRDVEEWPPAWWNAVLADLRRLADADQSGASKVPDTVTGCALLSAMAAIDARSRAPSGLDEESPTWLDEQDVVLQQVCVLPNTTSNLHIRARAVGCAVGNTSDLANLDLHELCAHLPERGVEGGDGPTGELIRQILACIQDGQAAVSQSIADAGDPDEMFHSAWREFATVKLADGEAIVQPHHRTREVDHILFCRDAETVAGVALKLRAALYSIAADRSIEAEVLGTATAYLDERLWLADIPERVMWSAIKTLERLGGAA